MRSERPGAASVRCMNPMSDPTPAPPQEVPEEILEISSGTYQAELTPRGAQLRRLRYDGRDLVLGAAAGEDRSPLYTGKVLAPWPNRIVDGRYTFAGETHELAVNEPERGHALHGLVHPLDAEVATHTADRVVFVHRLEEPAGYPFRIEVSTTYTLGEGGLACRISARNTGTVPAPYGCGSHPYLLAGPGPVDGWTLTIPATEYLRVTGDRLVPLGTAPVDGTAFDFRSPRLIEATALDHAFTGLVRDGDAIASLRVAGPSGTGVELRWEEGFGWVHVFTADKPGAPWHRTAVAVEPTTCPPDAFNSGVDLVVLEPGAEHAATWWLSA